MAPDHQMDGQPKLYPSDFAKRSKFCLDSHHMGLDATEPVFWDSDKLRFKYSATGTS